MGTTAEKLAYLKETKNQIKNALETPSNIFRDYPSLIKKYIDNQPTKVVSDGVCSNAVDLPTKAINVDGNSEQKTTDGRQLFDNTLKGYGHYGVIAKTIPTGVRLSVSTDVTASKYFFGVYATINLSNFVGKTVRMKAMFKSNSNLKGTYSIGLCDSNGTNRVSKDYTGISGKEISFVVPNLEIGQEYLGVWFYANSGGTGVAGDYVDYTNVIITIDNEDMTYEPYTGGTPSPNPDFPQDIEVIDGVNLFDANAIPNNTNIVVEDNGKTIKMPIVTSGNGAVNTNKKLSELCPNLNVGDTAYLYFDRNKSIDGENEVIYLRECTTYWKIGTSVIITQEMLNSNVLMYGNRYISGETDQIILTNFQITKGTTPKPYLPHGCIGLKHTNEDGSKSEIIPINLNGNSIAKVGNVKDLLKIYRNGDVEIEKNVNKKIISITSILNIGENTGAAFSANKKPNNRTLNTALCDKAIQTEGSKFINGTFYENPGVFVIIGEKGDTLEDMKQKYDGAELYYQLATPETIKLPSIEPIELWEGTNIFKLITNLDTTFEMEYVVNKDYIMNTLEPQNLLNIVEGENI